MLPFMLSHVMANASSAPWIPLPARQSRWLCHAGYQTERIPSFVVCITYVSPAYGRPSWFVLSLGRGREGGQASSEDLFLLGYGEWERIKVRVKSDKISLYCYNMYVVAAILKSALISI